MRLQYKILIVIFLIATLPLGAVSFLAFREFRDTIEQETISYLTSTNLQKKELIEGWLESGVQQIEIVAEMIKIGATLNICSLNNSVAPPEDIQFQPSQVMSLLNPVVQKNIFTELFILCPESGEVQLSTDMSQQGKLMPHRSFFILGQNSTFIQNVHYSMSIRQPTMVISTPIRDAIGTVKAVLAGRLDLSNLSKIMELRSNHKKTEQSYLVNTQNMFITDPRFESNFALKKTCFTEGVKKALRQQTGSAQYQDYKNTPVLGAYMWINERKMALVTEIEQQELLSPANKQRGAFISFTILAGFMALMFSGLALSRVFPPLINLLKAIKEVGAGNLAFRPELTGSKEIRDLSQAFSDMTVKLQNTLVSRDELVNEVIVRKNIEKELKETLSNLNSAHKKLQHETRERWLAVEKSVQLGQIVENSINQIFIIDVNSLHFIYANRAAIDNTGYSLKELKEITIFEIDASMSAAEINNRVQQLRDQKIKNMVFETMLSRKDGSFFSVKIFLNLMNFDNRDALVAIIDDVTEKQQLEAQLRQSQKMEAIGTLAGGIAHDFNNILASILGYAKLARETAPEQSQLADDLDNVISSGVRASELVKQILTYSRKEKTTHRTVNFSAILMESVSLLRASIPTTIQIDLEIEKDTFFVKADATQLHQVILNLCTNSAQAMDDGGLMTIALKTGNFSKSQISNRPDLRDNPTVVLTVTDSGIGIKKNLLHRIFDPYFTTKEIGKGSGMGLAVVSGIVESHGGAIMVDSTVGEGTTFSVFIPTVEVAQRMSKDTISSLPRGTEHILVVDDEEKIVKITKRNLEQLGYKVTGFTESQMALDDFRKSPDSFDLVLTDQTMPELAGDQLSAELLQIRDDLPILICSGYSKKMDDQKAKSLGIRSYLMKPIDLTDLAITIRNELDRGIKD